MRDEIQPWQRELAERLLDPNWRPLTLQQMLSRERKNRKAERLALLSLEALLHGETVYIVGGE